MGPEDPYDLVGATKKDAKKIKRIIRQSFDLLIDLRHWTCLCKLGRRVNKSPAEVLWGLLEKAFLELHMISKADDMLDEHLTTIRTKLARFRKQPENLNQLITQRGEELIMLAEVFPEELTASTADLISRIYQKYHPPEISPLTQPVPSLGVDIERRLNDLVSDLTPRLPQSYRKTFDTEDAHTPKRKRSKRRRG